MGIYNYYDKENMELVQQSLDRYRGIAGRGTGRCQIDWIRCVCGTVGIYGAYLSRRFTDLCKGCGL